MSLKKFYPKIKECIVAFTQKYTPVYGSQPPPLYPHIIGTGFIVREDGLIVTNNHVVEVFEKLPRPPSAPIDEWPVQVKLFKYVEPGLMEITLEIIGVLPTALKPGPDPYNVPEGPDLAFVQVKATGLPKVDLTEDTIIAEGLEIGTAGFPMGTEALTAPKWLHQISPTLQKGIVSAVQPFAQEKPYSFSINTMTQGGASGSPVFSCETGLVIGALFAGLYDIKETLKSNEPYQVPTNISYVVPSHYILEIANSLESHHKFSILPDTKTLDQIIEENKKDIPKGMGKRWEIKKWD